MILGEDDRLSETVAAGNPDSALHQMCENLVDRVFVHQPLVDRSRFHSSGDLAALVPLDLVPLFLLLVGEIVVRNPLPHELDRHRNRLGWNQHAILHGRLEIVGVGGDAALEIEKLVRVAIDLVFGCGGQTDEQ